MVYEERNAWAGLIVGVVVIGAYVVIVLQQAAGGPVTDVDWFPLMMWTCLLYTSPSPRDRG